MIVRLTSLLFNRAAEIQYAAFPCLIFQEDGRDVAYYFSISGYVCRAVMKNRKIGAETPIYRLRDLPEEGIVRPYFMAILPIWELAKNVQFGLSPDEQDEVLRRFRIGFNQVIFELHVGMDWEITTETIRRAIAHANVSALSTLQAIKHEVFLKMTLEYAQQRVLCQSSE